MKEKKLYDFGQIVIARLGELVKELKDVGLANGLREEDIKQVWRTAFYVLGKHSAISRQKLSQNLRRR